MTALREVIERKGAFCALYSDRASHFFHTSKAGQPVDRTRPTQVGRALQELGIQMIPAYSPQAREDEVNGISEPGMDGCFRNGASRGSTAWRVPMRFFGSIQS